jgi:hypothetical protein
MATEYHGGRAALRGVATVDDAEALLAWLQAWPGAEVDLEHCDHLHPANLQVLLAGAARVAAWPRDDALRAWLEPLLGCAPEQE